MSRSRQTTWTQRLHKTIFYTMLTINCALRECTLHVNAYLTAFFTENLKVIHADRRFAALALSFRFYFRFDSGQPAQRFLVSNSALLPSGFAEIKAGKC